MTASRRQRQNLPRYTVLAAVADGNSTRNGIAGYLERKATDISHHLSVLEDAGLLTREVDAFRPGRSVYRIREPLITFYHAIMRPEWSRLERRGLAAQVPLTASGNHNSFGIRALDLPSGYPAPGPGFGRVFLGREVGLRSTRGIWQGDARRFATPRFARTT
jgi:hypothetical protein